jgi:hypothetical protein
LLELLLAGGELLCALLGCCFLLPRLLCCLLGCLQLGAGLWRDGSGITQSS